MDLKYWQIGSTAAIVVSACIYVALERKYPYTKGQKLFREGFFNDFVLYTLVQSYLLGLVIAWIIRGLNGGPETVPRWNLVTGWPLWAQFLFFFVTHDFYIYCFHRAQHANKYLWRIHEAHHSVKDVDWLAGSRSHALEIMINQTIEFAPIVLLGAAPEIAILKGTVDAVWGMWIHSNIDVRTGWLQKIINGPEMHRWHHAIEITEGGINFGTKLAIWDWLFGTAHLPKEKPSGFGLSDVEFPKNYFVQHVFAFRRFPRRSPSPAPREAAPASTSPAE
jgi:sterol desaturase/sphingolipid hydroxylase (fatty acid hydroxylase superfamily)